MMRKFRGVLVTSCVSVILNSGCVVVPNSSVVLKPGKLTPSGSTSNSSSGSSHADDSMPTHQWTRTLGSSGAMVIPHDIVVDSSSNVFIVGNVEGAGFDGYPLLAPNDHYITKFDSAGTKQWSKQVGIASKSTVGGGVVADSSGGVVVAGHIIQDRTLFLTKYDSTGTEVWTRQSGAGSLLNANAAATDSSGNIFVAGDTAGGLDGNTLTGNNDGYVTKFDSMGTKQWTRQLGVASKDMSTVAVATDANGNVFIAGYIIGGGLDGNTPTGITDSYVTKFDSMGTKQWTKQLGVASQYTYANAVTTDSSGNIFVVGSTTGGLDGNALIGSQDAYVTKYNPNGTKLWTKQLGVASKQTSSSAIATDSSGNIIVAGGTDGGLDGNTLTGNSDIFVTKYNSSGVRQWTFEHGASGSYAGGNVIAIDSSAHLYIGGSVSGAGIDGLPQLGNIDTFISKY